MEEKITLDECKPKKLRLRKAQIQDDSIMGTNNSSIVSKRSVERLYFPDEPHYFRFFVKKPQRRAPLINRGYWLRMKAIDHVVRRFLETPSKKQKKVVINLGCGYDPLPWQCLSRYPSVCNGVTFVDIDYAELMLKKRSVVQTSQELCSMLTNCEKTNGDVIFRSDQYIQLGCDLRELSRLEKALASVVDFENSELLFTAEVSITYMDSDASDALINWASGLPDAQFCLLEQLLPNGIGHPFARTMMAHFNKLQTPLGAVEKYPTKTAQEQRFVRLGWANASALNLWEMWSSSDFVSRIERLSLQDVEPFDEWEEFALFGCHYFLLVADNIAQPCRAQTEKLRRNSDDKAQSNFTFSENPKSQGLRRFAAALPVRITGQLDDAVGIFAGMDTNTRTATCDLYTHNLEGTLPESSFAFDKGPSSRVCHTVTDLGVTGSLLIGGRTSPDNALADCWLYHKWLNIWERITDIPYARYRHSAVDLGDGYALISPGRGSSRDIAVDYFVWSRVLGWRRCKNTTDDGPSATYGSTFSIFDTPTTVRRGILAGGMSDDGVVGEDAWLWEVQHHKTKDPTIRFERSVLSDKGTAPIARFGAVSINHSGRLYILGGIVNNKLLQLSNEICQAYTQHFETIHIVSKPVSIPRTSPRPLFIGVTAIQSAGSVLITGGGAVCFSFGTFWNAGCFAFTAECQIAPDHDRPAPYWKFWAVSGAKTVLSKPMQLQGSGILATVPRVKIHSRGEFDSIVRAGTPVILETLDLGPCTKKWTANYLKRTVGAHHEVIIHEASSKSMNFQSKDFLYVKKAFGEFIDQAEDGARLYLRSLSTQNPAQLPADIQHDFPSIAGDFQVPPELAMILETFHSSPLRISGPVIMWLHYDVMANVLCQIRGSKRLILFPPGDIKHFKFDPGASSTGINCFDILQESTIPGTHPHEAILLPGDTLFLPPLWLHTALPTSVLSIAVNVFFRNLQTGYAAGRDVYGNRDLQAYEKGRQDVAKIVKSFDNLPMDMRVFYLSRLAQEFEQLAS